MFGRRCRQVEKTARVNREKVVERIVDRRTAFVTDMLIGGQPVLGEGESSDALDPATGSLLASVPEATERQVDAAVQAARKAFPAWSRTTPAERARLLLKLAEAIERTAPEIARVESLNAGKFERHTFDPSNGGGEIPWAADLARYYAGAARCLVSPSAGEYMGGHTSMVRHDPLGVVAAIPPWNYPFYVAIKKIAPVLAAGNTLVLKPSEVTPLSILAFAKSLAEIFPPGVVNIVTGRGPTTSAALCRHPGVAMVSLTGATATGTKVLEAVAPTVKRTHLELGGKAPVIVFEDADLDAAIAMLRDSAFYNAGQDCTQPCRVITAAKIYDRLLDRLLSAVRTVKAGDQQNPDAELGPLISARHRERVAGCVEQALTASHVELLAGGRALDRSGFFYAPTLLAGVRREDRIFREEVFGPVLTVSRFADPDEAIELANDCDYGLAAYVWTRDVSQAMRSASRLQFGHTWINTTFNLVREMPHGGMKGSGYGRELSVYGLEDYTVTRHVMVKFN